MTGSEISLESTLLDHNSGQNTQLNTVWQLMKCFQTRGNNIFFLNISHKVKVPRTSLQESNFFSNVRDIDGINRVLPRPGGLPFRAVIDSDHWSRKLGWRVKRNRGDWMIFVTHKSVLMDGREERLDQSQGLRCSSSIWRLLVGHRRGWLEQFVLWLFRLSVDSDDPGEDGATDKQHGSNAVFPLYGTARPKSISVPGLFIYFVFHCW